MRSWREVAPFAVALGSCAGPEAPPACAPDDPLTWTSFGEPFVRSWCTGCHSSRLEAEDRQWAPLGVDFDTLAGVRAHAERMRARTVGARDMPPAGGPDDADRDRFDRWLACGAPGEDAPPTAPTEPTPPEDTGVAPPGCGRVGRWVLTAATCAGVDVTDTWTSMFPLTELVITELDGTCAIEYHVADAGCDERQAWRSDLVAPTSPVAFLGTTACEPASCAWEALPDDVCAVGAAPVTLEVPIVDLPDGGFAVGPLSPPDLAPLCAAIGLAFAAPP